MIDPHWELVDLDPLTWRAIGRFILPGQYVRAGSPDEHALYVLHDRGRVLNVHDTVSGKRPDLGIERIDEPATCAAELFARGEWDRVHVIDRSHLADVAARAQESPRRDLTLDAYYRMVYHLIWNDDGGYVSVPPKSDSWNGWTYAGVKAWVEALPSPSAIALGVFEGEDLLIGLIAVVRDGLIRKVTTFGALPLEYRKGAVNGEFLDRLWTLIGERIETPAVGLVCTSDVFEEWIAKPDKSGIIERAVASGGAFVRRSR